MRIKDDFFEGWKLHHGMGFDWIESPCGEYSVMNVDNALPLWCDGNFCHGRTKPLFDGLSWWHKWRFKRAWKKYHRKQCLQAMKGGRDE